MTLPTNNTAVHAPLLALHLSGACGGEQHCPYCAELAKIDVRQEDRDELAINGEDK